MIDWLYLLTYSPIYKKIAQELNPKLPSQDLSSLRLTIFPFVQRASTVSK